MNILLIDNFPEKMIKQLKGLHAHVHYHPEWKRPEILASLSVTDILVMNSKVKIDQELINHAPRLKMICRAGVGLDHFDLPLCAERQIKIVNTPGANAPTVGEQAIGMLLSLMHRISRADKQVRNFQWQREDNRATELMGKTVGIIGYGNTGTAFAKRLAGFGCHILAYDKYRTAFGTEQVQEASLAEIQAQAQVLSLHIPLTAETTGLINLDYLRNFKHPLWFLNLSRGPIVVLEDLMEALDSGKVIAAGLDVLPNEKFTTLSPDETATLLQLFNREDVILTPHTGGWSHESLDRINNWIVHEIYNLINSQA